MKCKRRLVLVVRVLRISYLKYRTKSVEMTNDNYNHYK